MKKRSLSIISFVLFTTLNFNVQANELNEQLKSNNSSNNSIVVSNPIESLEKKNKTFKEVMSNILSTSLNYLGTPYKWGGISKYGFDCSGFVKFVYSHSAGLNLPRTSKEMSQVGTNIKNTKELMPGDLVFFNTRRFNFSHVGIYLGDNKFIHAPRTGKKVKIEQLDDSYWANRFNGARRII